MVRRHRPAECPDHGVLKVPCGAPTRKRTCWSMAISESPSRTCLRRWGDRSGAHSATQSRATGPAENFR